MQRYGKLFPIRKKEPYKDRQGNWKQTRPHYVKVHGQKVCAITDKYLEETKEETWEDARAKRMQDSVKEKEVVTLPRKKR